MHFTCVLPPNPGKPSRPSPAWTFPTDKLGTHREIKGWHCFCLYYVEKENGLRTMKTICWGRVVQGGDSTEISGVLAGQSGPGHSTSGPLPGAFGGGCLRTETLRRVPALKDWDARKGPRPQGLGCSEGSPPSRTGMRLAGWFRIEVTPPRVGLQIHSINHQQLQLQNP